MLNARIRKRFLAGGLKIAAIGPVADLTFPVQNLGAGPQTLAEVAEGRHPFFETLKSAKKPMLIIGQGALRRGDGAAVLASARALAEAAGMVREDWNGFCVLHTAASRVGGLDLGLVPGTGGRDVAGILDGAGTGDISVVYLLGADEIDTRKLGNAFVIYQGHHGDAGANRADVILPGSAYTEKNGTYVNTEGRVQLGRLAVFPPGEAREDWKILRALSDGLGQPLAYDNLGQVRRRLVQVNPVFGTLETAKPGAWGAFGQAGPMGADAFALPIRNFYMTDAISRASPTMAECTTVFASGQARTGTHG